MTTKTDRALARRKDKRMSTLPKRPPLVPSHPAGSIWGSKLVLSYVSPDLRNVQDDIWSAIHDAHQWSCHGKPREKRVCVGGPNDRQVLSAADARGYAPARCFDLDFWAWGPDRKRFTGFAGEYHFLALLVASYLGK